jgi:nucleotide-binding universal stress UspA family protein
MTRDRRPRSVLVPILGGDITVGALAYVRSALAGSDARLAFLYVIPAGGGAHHWPGEPTASDDAQVPRWRQAAAVVHPDRVFVDVVSGDPADVIPSQSRRFDSDLIVLGRPPRAPSHTMVDQVTARVLRAGVGRVLVVTDGGDGADEEQPIRVDQEPDAAALRPTRPHRTWRHRVDPPRAGPRAAEPRRREVAGA